MIVGEAPGEQEAKAGVPFVGESGKELTRVLLEAGIHRAQCFLTNVVRVQPPDSNIEHFIAARKADITPQHLLVRDKYCLPVVSDGIAQLQREIELVQPNVIIALGNVALWALTGQWGISFSISSSCRTITTTCPSFFRTSVLMTAPPASSAM
jgi:DNA polymerase